MANQFTKAADEGKDKPKGANQFTKGSRVEHDETTRAKIRAAFAADKLEDYLKGKCTLEASHVAAAKALMDKGMPSLQAVEQTNVQEPATEAEIMAQLRALLADPGTRAQLQAMLTASPAPVAPHQSEEKAA